MGSNMQAQAVPLVSPDLPMVSTGMERYAAMDSGQVVTAEKDGDVLSVTGKAITVRTSDGETELCAAEVSAFQSEYLHRPASDRQERTADPCW